MVWIHILLALGMDGPNVNKSFQFKLVNELEGKGSIHFLDVETCSLHTVSNAFSNGLKIIESVINLNQFARDLRFFFKRLAAKRENYKDVTSITDITSCYVQKHCQTCWLSLNKVLVSNLII